MRKVITSNLVSLDGYIAGPGGDLSWHVVDQEFFDYALNMLNSADLLVFGRLTYDLMAGYWPTATGDDLIAGKMNGLHKIVFSTTLESAGWEHTTLFKSDIEKNIRELKQQPGKDIVILGSGTIVSVLTQAGLIDEHRLIIVPVMLGAGTLQYTGNIDRKQFALTGMTKYSTGVVTLYYQPIK